MNTFHTVTANDAAFWPQGGIQEEDLCLCLRGLKPEQTLTLVIAERCVVGRDYSFA
jgi:hypothetical protein